MVDPVSEAPSVLRRTDKLLYNIICLPKVVLEESLDTLTQTLQAYEALMVILGLPVLLLLPRGEVQIVAWFLLIAHMTIHPGGI